MVVAQRSTCIDNLQSFGSDLISLKSNEKGFLCCGVVVGLLIVCLCINIMSVQLGSQ